MDHKKNILYIQTSGVEMPERTYAPFILGTSAIKEMGIEASIFFGIKGVTIAKRGEADKITLPLPFGSLVSAIEQARKVGVSFFVCEESAQMHGIDLEEGLIEGVTVVPAGTLNKLVLKADDVLSF